MLFWLAGKGSLFRNAFLFSIQHLAFMFRQFLLFFFSTYAALVWGQAPQPCPTPPTAKDFDIAITKAICEGDGEINISTTYDLGAWKNVIYTLHYPTGPVIRQNSPHFGTLSSHANDYVLVVSGECSQVDAEGTPLSTFSVTKSFKLGGSNRRPHEIEFIPTTLEETNGSRASFIDTRGGKQVDLRLGKIALYVTTNLDPERISFQFLEAPDPALVGTTDQYTLVPNPYWKKHRYILNGLYPAGHYKLYVSDGCSKIPIEFTLDGITQLASHMLLHADRPSSKEQAATWPRPYSCNTYTLTAETGSLSPGQLFRYRSDHLMQYAITLKGEAPTEWLEPVNGINLAYTHRTYIRLPQTHKDLYGKAPFEGHIRLRNTDITFTFPIPAWYAPPELHGMVWNQKKIDCGFFSTPPLALTDPVCFPAHVTVFETGNEQNKVYDNPEYYPKEGEYTQKMKYNTSYTYRIIAGDGYRLERTFIEQQKTWEERQFAPYYMDGMRPIIKTNNFCGTRLRLKKKKTSGEGYDIVAEQAMSGLTDTLDYHIAYDTDYILEHLPAEGDQPLATLSLRHSLQIPPKVTLDNGWQDGVICNGEEAREHLLRNRRINWRPYHSYSNYNHSFPIGTIFTLSADDASSFTPETFISTTGVDEIVFPGMRSLPPGNYTLTCNIGGQGQIVTYPLTFKGGFALKDPLSLRLEENCNRLNVTPHWSFTFGDRTLQTASCLFFKYNEERRSWEHFAYGSNDKTVPIITPGRYLVQISGNQSFNSCIWGQEEFVFQPKRPKLTASQTLAFACNPNELISAVMIGVQGGTAPYNYELFKSQQGKPIGEAVYKALNQPEGKQIIWDIDSHPEYLVRVTDGCSEQADFLFTPKPLDQVSFALANSSEVCEGLPLEVYTYDIPGSTYEWTLPDGSKSHSPVLHIPTANAQQHSGTYHIKVNTPRCGKIKEDEIQIRVLPRIHDITLPDADACVDVSPVFHLNYQGGRPPFHYRWEEYNATNKRWEATAHEHSESYRNTGRYTTSTLLRKPIGTTLQVRCVISDGCDREVITPIATATVRDCYVPVNPQLMHPVQGKP